MTIATASAPVIEFDDATHAYSVNGKPMLSVTQVLESVGISDFSMVPPAILRHAAERGTAVHRACWYMDQGDLDESTVDPEIRPYLDAWHSFMTDHRYECHSIEQRIWHPTFGYCGTFDRLGTMRRFGLTMLDIKTGEESPSWRVQLAAYAKARFEHADTVRRLAVQLRNDGRYELHWYDMRDLQRDFSVLVGALSVANFKKEFGIR